MLTSVLLCVTMLSYKKEEVMTTKTETLNLRVLPSLKDKVEQIAQKEQRSKSQMVSIILDKYIQKYELSGDSA